MTETTRTILVCSCEDTLPLDLKALNAALPGARLLAGRQLCGAEIDTVVRAGAADAAPLIACARMAPVFEAAFDDAGIAAEPAYATIRETAGWSAQGQAATPKIAALLALAAEPSAEVPMLSLTSEGVAIVYGTDETAFEVAARLSDTLDITVVLSRPDGVMPPRAAEFPIFRGTIRSATGHLGAFRLGVDDFAAPAPSSRGALRFAAARNGARSECDLIIDVSGGTPLFPAAELRPGYLRCDPRDPAARERLIAEAREMVGTFDKPRYVAFDPGLCAHARSRITGCTRCLDVCPTGAITPNGDAVTIDPAICAGCGGCGALCPTGAASYALPTPERLMHSLRTLLTTYRRAGGTAPLLLIHDSPHGEELIHALSHQGAGLPAHVLPVAVNEVTQLGLEQIAAAFAYGAAALRVITRSKPRHDETALHRTLDQAGPILAGLGFAADAVGVIATDDPDALGAALDAVRPGPVALHPATFLPAGGKSQLQRLALGELHAAAPAPVERIALPAGAPMGRVTVRAEGCTLCLACVSACPTAALAANPDRPELTFAETLCVQCGLCARTCPEKVITLEPRLDFAALAAPPVTLKQEDPYPCDACGKHFGTRATIEKIRARLAGSHWMFAGANAPRLDLIGLCEDCRVIAATRAALDPYAAGERPRPRTADDYRTDSKKPNGAG